MWMLSPSLTWCHYSTSSPPIHGPVPPLLARCNSQRWWRDGRVPPAPPPPLVERAPILARPREKRFLDRSMQLCNLCRENSGNKVSCWRDSVELRVLLVVYCYNLAQHAATCLNLILENWHLESTYSAQWKGMFCICIWRIVLLSTTQMLCQSCMAFWMIISSDEDLLSTNEYINYSGPSNVWE